MTHGRHRSLRFQEIYGLETTVIPPNRPSKRDDQLDRVYKTTREKYEAAIKDIRECHERGQPVLVGTTSIENSEIIDQLLNKEGLPHQVLNAKQHAREADIVAQAGRAGMITIATNMAGRGTDIVLGGNIEKLWPRWRSTSRYTVRVNPYCQTRKSGPWTPKDQGLGCLRIIATERTIRRTTTVRGPRAQGARVVTFYLSLDDR